MSLAQFREQAWEPQVTVLADREEFEHPYNNIDAVPSGTRTLIVGTCPPHRFCVRADQIAGDVPFYYGSVDNYLWNDILPKALGRAIPATREGREGLLKEYRLWMFDIFQRFTRRDLTASDSSLALLRAGEIGRLLRERPTIDAICFTGTTAERETREKLIKDGLLDRNSTWIRAGDMPRRNRLALNFGREITAYTLPSPNPNSARSGYSLEVQVRIYTEVLAKLCHTGGKAW